MIDWKNIDTVLLDMDGTLLDLNFDNQFWLEHLPRRYADKHGISISAARDSLVRRFKAIEGTLNWYCLDYWSDTLQMDIALLKDEVAHLIAVHPHVIEFLAAIRNSGRRAVLVTNAHAKSLSLKLKHTRLDGHLDAVICAHDLKLPKEEPRFWARLQVVEPFDPRRTLLIDDNLTILRCARDYGIAMLLAVAQPDSCRPQKDAAEFDAVSSFTEIMPRPRS